MLLAQLSWRLRPSPARDTSNTQWFPVWPQRLQSGSFPALLCAVGAAACLQSVLAVDVLAGKTGCRIFILFISFFIALHSEVSYILLILVRKKKKNKNTKTKKEPARKNLRETGTRFVFVFIPGVLGLCFFHAVIADSPLPSTGSEPAFVLFFQLTEDFLQQRFSPRGKVKYRQDQENYRAARWRKC